MIPRYFVRAHHAQNIGSAQQCSARTEEEGRDRATEFLANPKVSHVELIRSKTGKVVETFRREPAAE